MVEAKYQIAVYPGSFDPITIGHVNVAERSANLFDEVIVGVYADSAKPGAMFSIDERVALSQVALSQWENIRVEPFTGLTVDFARSQNANVIVRGLRAVSDFEYEFKMSHMNHYLAPEIEVVCLMTSSRHSFVSSSMIREVATLGGDVSGLVPSHVQAALARKFSTPNVK